MEVCENFKRRVEEKVEKPMDKWIEKRTEKCKKGKWYNPFTWLCWFVTALVMVVRWVVVTVIKWVLYVVCKIVSFVLFIIGFLFELLKSIPFLGPIINILHQLFTFIVNLAASIIPIILDVLGVNMKKYLRITIVIQRNEKKNPIARFENLIAWVEEAQKIFKQANVEVFVDWRTMNDPSPNENLYITIPSDKPEDIGLVAGNYFSLWMSRFRRWLALWAVSGSGGRLLGIAATLVCYVVESIDVLSSGTGSTSKNGFSWGPFEDFIIVKGTAAVSSLAHEIGHSCLLGHERKDDSNLMFTPGRTANNLTKNQIFFIRNSKYVSMF